MQTPAGTGQLVFSTCRMTAFPLTLSSSYTTVIAVSLTSAFSPPGLCSGCFDSWTVPYHTYECLESVA